MHLPAKRRIGVLVTIVAVVIGPTVASASARVTSTPESARARTDAEAQIARANLGGSIEAALGGSFAGAWFDPSAARVHVGVTSPGSRRLVERK